MKTESREPLERIGRVVGYIGVIFLIGYVAVVAFGLIALVSR